MDKKLDYIKSQIIGSDHFIETPFGKKIMLYLDYTASGRNLLFIENYLLKLEKEYANTHTEDDETGWATTERSHQAEKLVKKAVGANEKYRIIFTGTGTTGGIQKLMEILGIYYPPTLKKVFKDLNECAKKCNIKKPVVFVGPYEHHSNLVTWREGFCDFIPIRLNEKGELSLEDLEKKVTSPRWEGRTKIVSISAASNVTGLKTDTSRVAEIAHKNDCLVFFDYAACAPYVPIKVYRDENNFFDAVFFSPHKFLGGPGSSGVLVFHERIYDRALPPTFGGGGTVSYVNEESHDFIGTIEEREKAGTPGILQSFKTALALELKSHIGCDYIQEREDKNLEYFCERWGNHPSIEILGPKENKNKIGIISYNIKHKDKYFHPKFISKLLNDLFGIQSRAGCSCAGPYGHYLLNISLKSSNIYREAVKKGYSGFKPGWARINLHYTLDKEDLDFIIDTIDFILKYGERFLALYEFNPFTGDWIHKNFKRNPPDFSLNEAFKCKEGFLIDNTIDRPALYKEYLKEAKEIGEKLPKDINFLTFKDEFKRLSFFYTVNITEKGKSIVAE